MNDKVKIGIAFALIYLIWGSTYLAIATAVKDVPPVFMVAARGMLAGGALYWLARRRGSAPFALAELIEMVPTAALLFAGGYVLVGWAEQHVPSGAAALLNSSTPAWVVLLEWLSRRRRRPDVLFLGALGLGVAGVAVLVGGGDEGTLPILPSLALVGSSLAWAAGTLRTRLGANGDPGRKAALQLITGGLLLLPLSAATGELPRIAAGFSMSAIVALAYLVVGGSLIGYTAYVWLLHHVSASKVASHSYVNPLIAVILGSTLAGEGMYATTLAAASLILVSVFFIVRERPAGSAAPREIARPFPRPRIAATAECRG